MQPRNRFFVFGFSAAIVLAAWPAASPAQQSAVPTSWILHNGKIVTQDARERAVQALAVMGDRVLAAGAEREVLGLRAAGSCVLDLKGRTVVPGFADGHLHSSFLRNSSDVVNLTPVRSLGELLGVLRERAAKAPKGLLIVTNNDWHEAQLAEKRMPNRWELDTASREHPIIVVRGGHQYILNSAALEHFRITKDTQSPPGGKIVFDAERGDINGELVDKARDLAPLPADATRTLAERVDLMRREHLRLNALGLTSVRDPGVSQEVLGDYAEWRRGGDHTMRVSVLYRWDRKEPAKELRKRLEDWPVSSGFGDEWLRLDGVKLGVDGGYEGGWMREPYAEPFGNRGTYFGLNTVPRAEFMDVVAMLHDLGIRPSTHAVGDAALDLVLDAYEAADRKKSIRAQRWAIEHSFITQANQIRRVADLGLILSAQSHLYLAGPSLLKYWGPQRTAQVAPARTWLDAGLLVAGGTDNKLPYVPEAPLTTFYHWVSRDTLAGVLGKEQAITRKEALRIATLNNAYLTFEEDLKGSLEAGKLADLVVLSQDIMSVPNERLMQTKVLGTMVGGRFVYAAPELGASCTPRTPARAVVTGAPRASSR